jgi:hypothetical protein
MALKRLFSSAGPISVELAKAPRPNLEQVKASVEHAEEQDFKLLDKVLS